LEWLWLRDVFGKLPQHRGGEAFNQFATEQSIQSTELDCWHLKA
jgi:hypothetical protein